MLLPNLINDNRKHYLAFVGGGGKTTVMYELAAYLGSQGKRTVVMTTTHIFKPRQQELWINSLEELQQLWAQNSYGVMGQMEASTGKLIAPEPKLYQSVAEAAEFILCEADGAKGHPVKAPRGWEPVIEPLCDTVVGVVGLDCLGKTWAETCFGLAEVCVLLQIEPQSRVTVEKLAQLLTADQGTRKNVGQRNYYLVLNKLDLLEDKTQVPRLVSLLENAGIAKEHIWVRENR